MIAALLLAGAIVTSTPRGVLVAHDGALDLFDARTNLVWSTEGLPTPSAMATSNDRAALIDPLQNAVRVVDLATGRASAFATGETPIDARFVGDGLYLLERDARALERIGMDGARASISLAADPAFLREANGRLYVYSRTAGMLQEITTEPFAVRRSVKTDPFASDLEADGRNAYLVYPRGAKIAVVSLTSMQSAGTMNAGAVPVDMTLLSGPTALTARTFALADPSAKRVWIIEGSQSFSQSLARGFLRGLLGLGLFGGGASQFPSGVDRVTVRAGRWYAYDSSSGTLYRFTKRKSSVVAKNIAPHAFMAGPDALYVWNDAVRRLQRMDADE